jgi:hypothetical protein
VSFPRTTLSIERLESDSTEVLEVRDGCVGCAPRKVLQCKQLPPNLIWCSSNDSKWFGDKAAAPSVFARASLSSHDEVTIADSRRLGQIKARRSKPARVLQNSGIAGL